jgi:hypothetical protein
MSTDIAKRFARDTDQHEMTVLHNDGLYRHLRFQRTTWRPPLVKPLKHSSYWFDLITVPGSLIFRGDGESYVFSRDEDMIAFFRGSAWRGEPNVHYWAEKVTDGRDRLKVYDEDLFVQFVKEQFIETARCGGVPPGTGKALLANAEDYDLTYEENAREFLDDFEHKGFRFTDTWEWDFRDYDWWFLWALHAILWGIARFDGVERPAVPAEPVTVPASPVPSMAPAFVDVQLPTADVR